MKTTFAAADQKKRLLSPPGLEGTYIRTDSRGTRLTLKHGKWQYDDNPWCGSYRATRPDEFTCLIHVVWKSFDCSMEEEYRITRRNTTYWFEQLPDGGATKYRRQEGGHFLADSLPRVRRRLPASPTAVLEERRVVWRHVESNAKATFYLTGESVIRATTTPSPPTSKEPTVVRVTHANPLGRVDADVYIRLGDPKRPLRVKDFDTVSDWRRAVLVEDLLWSDERADWALKGKRSGIGSSWSGTYESKIQFPKGQHQIELKIISRVPEVCSIVLSNWRVYVR